MRLCYSCPPCHGSERPPTRRENLQSARETISAKRRRSTEESNLLDGDSDYNQSYFTDVESLLEKHCRSRGIHAVVFLPKFHRELNLSSSVEVGQKCIQDLPPFLARPRRELLSDHYYHGNPLQMMKKIATRSRCFMDADDRGLNGRQAA